MTDGATNQPRLRLEIPPVVRPGESVDITLRATNTGDASADLYLRGRTIAFDILVADAGGAIVWRRLEGEIIPAILRLETLAAGESMDFRDSWDQRSSSGETVAPGTYSVRGELLTDGAPLAAPAEPLLIRSD